MNLKQSYTNSIIQLSIIEDFKFTQKVSTLKSLQSPTLIVRDEDLNARTSSIGEPWICAGVQLLSEAIRMFVKLGRHEQSTCCISVDVAYRALLRLANSLHANELGVFVVHVEHVYILGTRRLTSYISSKFGTDVETELGRERLLFQLLLNASATARRNPWRNSFFVFALSIGN